MSLLQGKNELVIGILGGMGSYSTLHFFERILDEFPVDKEWQRPRIIIDNNCVLPSRVRALLHDEGRNELVQGMADSLERLATYNPHAVVIPCHTAHCFLPEVRKLASGAALSPFVDMIELTVARCAEAGTNRLYLMATEGTIATGIYEKYCAGYGISLEYPDSKAQAQIRAFIEQVKQRRGLKPDAFAQFVATSTGLPVVLGCTELSVLHKNQGKCDSDPSVIDPLSLMAAEIRKRSDSLAH